MGKVIKKSSGDGMFAKGGTIKMYGKGHSGPSPSGQSMVDAQPGASGSFAKGGTGKMFGKGHAGSVTSGQSMKDSQ